MNNNQEIIIPPPLQFRNKSVFVLCNPKKINFREELKRVYNKVIKYDTNQKRYLRGQCDYYSIFGQASRDHNNKIQIRKVYKDINNIFFYSIINQYKGYNIGLEKNGVEVLFIRSSKKTTDGKIKEFCRLKNNGERHCIGITVKELKDILKINGVKGYSKFDKNSCIKQLLKL